jgi:RimJ/RimL family protein N-acetyltransferase
MLQGERVMLRPIQSWDRERLYELVETIEVKALASGDPPLPTSLEEVDQDAIRTLVDYGFRHLNLTKISLRALADDDRAVGAYRKAGFVEEGRLRNHTWYDGERHDELVMAALREDWSPARPS